MLVAEKKGMQDQTVSTETFLVIRVAKLVILLKHVGAKRHS